MQNEQQPPGGGGVPPQMPQRPFNMSQEEYNLLLRNLPFAQHMVPGLQQQGAGINLAAQIQDALRPQVEQNQGLLALANFDQQRLQQVQPPQPLPQQQLPPDLMRQAALLDPNLLQIYQQIQQMQRPDPNQLLQQQQEQQRQNAAQIQLLQQEQQRQQVQQLLAQLIMNQQLGQQLVAPQVAQIAQPSPALPQYQIQAYNTPPLQSPAPPQAPAPLAQSSPAIAAVRAPAGQMPRAAQDTIRNIENWIETEGRNLARPRPAANVQQLPQPHLYHIQQQRQQQERDRQEQQRRIQQEQQQYRLQQEHQLRLQEQQRQQRELQIQEHQRQQMQQQQRQILHQQQQHAPVVQAPVPDPVQQVVQELHRGPQLPPNQPVLGAEQRVRAGTPQRGGIQRGRGDARRGRGARQRRGVEAPPRVDEALAYLRVIKNTFANDVPVYHRFLEIMKDFRAQRIETPDVIEQVAELLYNSPDLVLGFNTFLPNGFKITKTDDDRYVFTAPQAPPKFLLTPDERRQVAERGQAQAPNLQDVQAEPVADAVPVAVAARELGFHGDDGVADEDPMEQDNGDVIIDPEDSRIDDEKMDEGEEEEDQEPLQEEIVTDGSGSEGGEEEEEEEEDFSSIPEPAMRVLELLRTSFASRPGKLIDFLTFMDFFIASRDYYANKEKPSEVNKETGGPSGSDDRREEAMEVDDEADRNKEESKEKTLEIEKDLHKSAKDHIISMLAKTCRGEPQLLAASIDFLPYLREILDKASDSQTEAIRNIILCDPGHIEAPEAADENLVKQMEKCKMGTKKNEKLKIKNLDSSFREDEQDVVIFSKSYRILYENLKTRMTSSQLKNLLKTMHMYTNMDISKERLISEIPRILGVNGSEVEKVIVEMLGMNRKLEDQPEYDEDAVMRQDMPAIQAKRGLRDQKMLQHVQNVEAATVCTIGPSYRLLKDTKQVECSGRVELDPEIKAVLNDKWISYPSWSSEDVGTQAIKRSNLEEFHTKTEEERYELDIIVDSNKTIMEELKKILRDYENLSDEEKKKFKLNDTLNCSSRATFNRVMTKVFNNSVNSFIEAAKSNVRDGLKRIIELLTERDTSWVHFQQETNRVWREALDKQATAAMNIMNSQQKTNDQKAFKVKPLINAIEQAFEEKKSANDSSAHLTLDYPAERKTYKDVNEVSEHFFHELPNGKADRERVKVVIFKILMEWLCQPGQDVQFTLDSGEVYKFQGDLTEDENMLNLLNLDSRRLRGGTVTAPSSSSESKPIPNAAEKFRRHLHNRDRRVFYGDDTVYFFIRFHHMLIFRFSKILATQANYSQEYLDNQKKQTQWQIGVGAEMHGRRVFDRLMEEKNEAVNEIRNIRACPTGYYETTIRELKHYGKSPMDMTSLDDAIKHLFPGDNALFNCIDKLFHAFTKNVHHAVCTDDRDNPVKLYLEFRPKLMKAVTPEQFEAIVQEYEERAHECIGGKNMYRFEFVNEANQPHLNIWLIPNKEQASTDEGDDEDEIKPEKDDDEVGKEGDGAENDDDVKKEEGDEADDQEEEAPSGDRNEEEDGENDEDDEESMESPSTAAVLKITSELSVKKSVDGDDLKKKNMIEQAGCDMEVAFDGKYKHDKFLSIESNPGEMHRIYLQCIKAITDEKLWLPRTKLISRHHSKVENKGLIVMEKEKRQYNYKKINQTRLDRCNRFENFGKKRLGDSVSSAWFREFRPLS